MNQQLVNKANNFQLLMENSRAFEEDVFEHNQAKHSGLSTPAKSSRKNAVQMPKQPNKFSPSSKKKSPKSSQYPSYETIEQKTLISQQVRIKGQEKLVYLKQCHHKNYSPAQIFQHYPFSNMEIFSFNDQRLRDEKGHLTASIIEDKRGIHLVEQYKNNSNSRYITTEEEQQMNVFNGLSVSLFENGTIFEGMYHNGKCCGLGYQLQSNGNTYIGSFKDGIKNGNGTFYWFCNNEMYVGEWHGGLPHGLGIYIGKDRYQGNFLNGLKFGFGEQTFANGDKYVGEYVNSVADGYGEYYWSDKSIYKGDFKQGVRHGYGIWQDETQVYKGNYRLDKKQGYGVYVWRNKQIYKGQFKDDFRQGYGQFYSIVNGTEKLIYKGCWKKGKKYQEGKADEAIIKQLHLFLESSDLYDFQIQNNSKKERKRVGHKNCIPNQKHHQ